jgi:tubulin--tyrosine ligase
LSNKKALFKNLRRYYLALGRNPFENMPLTFHIKAGVNDKMFKKFSVFYESEKEEGNCVWLVKPGENTNCGRGISVCNTLEQIRKIVKS